MAAYCNEKILVEFDDNTGYLTKIQSKFDSAGMNWVLPDSDFGNVDNFKTVSISSCENGVSVQMKNELGIELDIQRRLGDEFYTEKYTFKNGTPYEWFINADAFGIHFPFATHVSKKENYQNTTCTSHAWCGGDICWIYSSKLSSDKPRLIMNMTEGSIDEYSISRDASRAMIGADYRGDIVLNPEARVVAPSGSATYEFAFKFTDKEIPEALLDFGGFISLEADKYTARIGETIKLRVNCSFDIKELSAEFCGKEIPIEKKKRDASFDISFDTLGEKKIFVYVNGKRTYIVLNIICEIPDILKSRTNFIVRKQQFSRRGSRLDGAYLAYDLDSDSMFYKPGADYNAGRERIAMGIAVLKQLQREHDENLYSSITKHRTFIERELFDETTGYVYNEVNRNSDWERIYNFPWFAIYFYEWFELSNEKRYLLNAANILIKYYELDGANQDSQGIEAYRIITALRAADEPKLADTLQREFINHADMILKRDFNSPSDEVAFVNEMPNFMASYLIQAYFLKNDAAYLEGAEKYIKASESFISYQPHYLLNCVSVRHWDRYWFGRHNQYGDIFPHHWSAILAETYWWYQKATGKDMSKKINTIIDANLSLFAPSGFAHNNYLFPYKVNVYASNPEKMMWGEVGSYYGKSYDLRANDQDWILYYAARYYQK